MRKCIRVAVLVVLGALSTAVLGVLTAIMSAVSLAATALIVPGTGTPSAGAVPGYMQNAVDYYLQDTFCGTEGGCDSVGSDLIGIDYPASFWPLVIFPGWCDPGRCEKWNDSVEEGVSGLNGELFEQWTADPDENIVVFGYSQGGAVVSNELRNLANLNPDLKEQLQVVMIGNIANPDGGLWSRLAPFSFLGELLLDATFGPPMATDTGLPITNIGFEYDPVVYAPLYWGNPLAMLNALAAFDTVHGGYLLGNLRAGELPYGYTAEELAEQLDPALHPENFRYGGNDPNSDNVYVMIPARSLPLMDLIMSAVPEPLRPLARPIVDFATPIARVIIDLAYDWSGDPDVARPLSILPFNPFTNWVQVGFDLVAAVQEGFENAFGGGTIMVAPPATAEVSALSARADEAPGQEPAVAGDPVEAEVAEVAEVEDVKADVKSDEDVKENEGGTDEAEIVEVNDDDVTEEKDDAAEEPREAKDETEDPADENDSVAGNDKEDDEAKDIEAKDDQDKDDQVKDDQVKDDQVKNDASTDDDASSDDGSASEKAAA